MTRAAAGRASSERGRASHERTHLPAGYMENSSRPLASLLIVLPALILYELGTRYFTTAALHGREQHIIAFSKLQQFFRLFGATGRHLPALAVVATLLSWHIARSDRWRVKFSTLAGMGFESLLLSLPIFFFSYIVARYYPLMGAESALFPRHLRDMMIMSLGAGVYEEFIFRLALFSLLSLLFKDVLKLNSQFTLLLMVLSSAGLFAAYHYLDPTQTFSGQVFAFRMVAGIYFGIVFLSRGFGITATSHSIYDIIISLLQST